IYELLVIDSRNIRLALPTELLLQNILRALYGSQLQLENEEVLRWPLVDNTFVSRTIDDARSVLQVWLEVELERRPVKRLLLMGENAAQYFLKADSSYSSSLFSLVDLQQFSTYALIAPSLVELLQRPELKRELWQALQPWRHVGETMSGSVNLTTSTGLLLNLRLLLEADLPAVMQLERAAHSHPWRQSSFEDCLRGRQRCWLAEYKGVLVGYVVVAHGGGDAELLNIA